MINKYFKEFGRNSVVEKKSENLTQRWHQLQKDLAKQKEDYGNQVKKLRTFEKNMVRNDIRLREIYTKINSLPPLTHGVQLLKQQEKETEVSYATWIIIIVFIPIIVI